MATVRFTHVQKIYANGFHAVHDFNLDIRDRELVILVGPSGCGKSTTMRMVAGLEDISEGSIAIGERVVNGVLPKDRNVAMVFQDYALYPHMTVEENMSLSLRLKGVPVTTIRKTVSTTAETLGLTQHLGSYPRQLSGGQRQRVALARALAPAPKLLLLDEPFAAVDAKVRGELRRWLRRLHDEMHVTSVFVTHDQEEAFAVADRVVMVNQGKVEQVGRPIDIFESPESEFVARFVGEVNIVAADVIAGRARAGQLLVKADGIDDGMRVRLIIRSYDMKFWRDDAAGIGIVRRIIPLGDRVRVEAEVPEVGDLFAHFPRRSSLLRGVEPGCRIAIEVTRARAYSAEG